MPDFQLIEKLKQGACVWNIWREKNHSIVPYFPLVQLRRANLKYVNLSKAFLSEANFF